MAGGPSWARTVSSFGFLPARELLSLRDVSAAGEGHAAGHGVFLPIALGTKS